MSFEADVNAWARKTETRLRAVFRSSMQEVARQAQEPQAKGGNLPVDTGFLRNSGGAALNDFPARQGEEGQEGSSAAKAAESATAAAIARANIGDEIIFGWTAVYARPMEARYGFMRNAADNWQRIVKREAEEIKRRATR